MKPRNIYRETRSMPAQLSEWQIATRDLVFMDDNFTIKTGYENTLPVLFYVYFYPVKQSHQTGFLRDRV